MDDTTGITLGRGQVADVTSVSPDDALDEEPDFESWTDPRSPTGLGFRVTPFAIPFAAVDQDEKLSMKSVHLYQSMITFRGGLPFTRLMQAQVK